MQPGAQLRAAARFVSPLSFFCRALPRRAVGAAIGLVFLLAAAADAHAAELGSPEVRAEVERLVQLARDRRLAERPMWWRLLHYRSGIFGVASEVDAGHFFNSPDGKTEPAAELDATLRGFFS